MLILLFRQYLYGKPEKMDGYKKRSHKHFLGNAPMIASNLHYTPLKSKRYYSISTNTIGKTYIILNLKLNYFKSSYIAMLF
jgi:hypothetical protein